MKIKQKNHWMVMLEYYSPNTPTVYIVPFYIRNPIRLSRGENGKKNDIRAVSGMEPT
jgi:hypothetical protein